MPTSHTPPAATASLTAAVPLFALGLFAGSGDWPSRIASAAALAAAFGLLFGIGLGAWLDRRRLAAQAFELRGAGPSWASRERGECHARAARRRGNQEAVGYDATDGDAARYIGAEVYEREYRETVDRWQRDKEAGLRTRTLLAGGAAVLAAVGVLLSLSPERVQTSGVLESMWPVALAIVLAVAVVLETILRAASWIRLFYDWKDWATLGPLEAVPIEAAEPVSQPPVEWTPLVVVAPPPPPVVSLPAPVHPPPLPIVSHKFGPDYIPDVPNTNDEKPGY